MSPSLSSAFFILPNWLHICWSTWVHDRTLTSSPSNLFHFLLIISYRSAFIFVSLGLFTFQAFDWVYRVCSFMWSSLPHYSKQFWYRPYDLQLNLVTPLLQSNLVVCHSPLFISSLNRVNFSLVILLFCWPSLKRRIEDLELSTDDVALPYPWSTHVAQMHTSNYNTVTLIEYRPQGISLIIF